MIDGDSTIYSPDSRVTRTWGGWLGRQVSRAEGSAVVYTQTPPTEELEDGLLVALNDFHLGAEVAETTRAVGTRVHKEVVMQLADREPPFHLVYNARPERPKAHGICTSFGYTQVWQDHFYVFTQALFELNVALETDSELHSFGEKGRMVIRAVLFDES